MIKLLTGMLLATTAAAANAGDNAPTFTENDFRQLKFLEGRWMGTDPTGAAFFEQYDFPDAATLRSQRFAAADFSAATDGSTVTLKDGEVISRWGDFSWRASEITPDKACFVPLKAPSAFCWKRVDATALTVTQNWKDGTGKDQSMTMTLKRVP